MTRWTPAGRSTRPIAANSTVGSAHWCIDSVLTTTSNDAAIDPSDATDGRHVGGAASAERAEHQPGQRVIRDGIADEDPARGRL